MTAEPAKPAEMLDRTLAKRLLGWKAERSIEQGCADGWRWQQRNPNGYRH